MRYVRGLLFLLIASVAQAAPSPAPPGDFSGDQYIDGAGCVFNRAGGRWIARTDRAGKAVCGFPSSLSARRTDPDAETVLAPLRLPESPDPAQLLREQLAGELRQGEFVTDPRQAEERREPEIPDAGHDLIAEAQARLKLRAAIGAKLASRPADSALCARLGYVPDPVPHPIPGGDVLSGFCRGQRPAVPEAHILPGKRLDREGEIMPRTAPAVRQASVASDTQLPVRRPMRDSAAPGKAAPVGKAKPAAPRRDPVPELIPASARYVQIGAFSNDVSSEPAIRHLSALGYPVARAYRQGADRKSRVILAGPFDDRRSLVAALNLLRNKGYRAVAR
ncbi:SPOR domain-containing protein [Paracoccus onubensis]|nr:SPOR domain-containing protein [Paracoccus onubensis]